ncbi:MAG: ABC transporter permease [Candidatus Bipolaricaulota bacterium]
MGKRWQKVKRHRLGLVGLSFLVLLSLMILITPLLPLHSPNEVNLLNRYEKPTLTHIFGTDQLGRDVLSRVLTGARVSLAVGLLSVAIQLVVAIPLGCLAVAVGGWLDASLQRIVEMFLSFPFLVIVLVLSSMLPGSMLNITLIIGLVGWPRIFRLVRGEALSVREEDYVEAAKSCGANLSRVVSVHVLPNILGTILVAATINCATAILIEAQISFLGFGIQPPTPTWGNMLMDATQTHILSSKPWMWMTPGFLVVTTLLSLNFVGDALRDAFDPYYYES